MQFSSVGYGLRFNPGYAAIGGVSRPGPDSTGPCLLNEAVEDLFQVLFEPQHARWIGHAYAR
jgi:hypothetical protein